MEWISADTIHKLETRRALEENYMLNNSRRKAAKVNAQEEYTAVDIEVERSIKKDKRDYIDDQSRHKDSYQHATQPLQQDLGEGGSTGPVERRNYHQAAKKKETLGTAATIESSCSCQHQARFSTGFYWRGWRRLLIPSSETTRQASSANVKSVLLYGCETWRTTQTMQQKIQTIFNTCLRPIYKIQWQEKIRNEDLWERAGQEPVAKQVLQRKWGWIGHTLRKPASSITQQALTWNLQGKRKRGRPCNSWGQDTEAGLKQQGTNWSRMTRTECGGKGSLMAYAPPGTMGMGISM